MALKLNIRPELEAEIDLLLPKAQVRSKTEYINRAIQEYNQKLKRQMELMKLKKYFQSYSSEAKKVMREFSESRGPAH